MWQIIGICSTCEGRKEHLKLLLSNLKLCFYCSQGRFCGACTTSIGVWSISPRQMGNLSGSTPSVREDTQSGPLARYRGCVTEITRWRTEETRWTTMVNRRNLLLSLLFPMVCSVNL